jgi:hypothetical protein
MTLFSTKSWLPYLYYIGRCFFGTSHSGLAQLHRVVVSLEQVALDLPNSTGVIYSTLFSLGQVNRGQLCPAWSRGLRRQPQPGNQTGKGRVDY